MKIIIKSIENELIDNSRLESPDYMVGKTTVNFYLVKANTKLEGEKIFIERLDDKTINEIKQMIRKDLGL